MISKRSDILFIPSNEYAEIPQGVVEADMSLSGNKNDAPLLECIRGFAYFVNWGGSAPKLHTIGGVVNFCDWRGTAPKLTSVNGKKFEWKKFWK